MGARGGQQKQLHVRLHVVCFNIRNQKGINIFLLWLIEKPLQKTSFKMVAPFLVNYVFEENDQVLGLEERGPWELPGPGHCL